MPQAHTTDESDYDHIEAIEIRADDLISAYRYNIEDHDTRKRILEVGQRALASEDPRPRARARWKYEGEHLTVHGGIMPIYFLPEWVIEDAPNPPCKKEIELEYMREEGIQHRDELSEQDKAAIGKRFEDQIDAWKWEVTHSVADSVTVRAGAKQFDINLINHSEE